MSLDANALITLEALKEQLEEAPNQDDFDRALEFMINVASELIRDEVKEDLVYTTYASQKISGSGITILRVPNRPIVALTTVVEDDITLTEDTDFYCHYGAGYLEKADGATWNKGIKNIELTYKAGYWVDKQTDAEERMPRTLQLACMTQASLWWDKFKKENWDEVSRSFPDGSTATLYSIIKEDIFPAVKKMCARHKRPIV